MKKSQTPLLVALAIILGLFVVLNELGRRSDDRTASPQTLRRTYANPYFGFALSLPEGWTLSTSPSAQHQQLMVTVDIRHLSTDSHVMLRVTEEPWEYFEPLVERPAGSERKVPVGMHTGRTSPVGRGGIVYTTVLLDTLFFEFVGPGQAVDTVISALRWMSEDKKRNADVVFQRPSSLPSRVAQWRQDCQALDLTAFGSVLHESGKTYVYVGSGRRPTGGYTCSVTRIHRTEADGITVFVNFTRPSLIDNVTQAYSHPYDLLRIDEDSLTATFFGDGNDAPPVISTLQGIDILEPVYDQSRTIKMFSPKPQAVAKRIVRFSGIVHGTVKRLFFRVLDSREVVLERKSIQVESSPHWIGFGNTLSLGDAFPPGETVYLELYTIDDASGDIVDQIRIPLQTE